MRRLEACRRLSLFLSKFARMLGKSAKSWNSKGLIKEGGPTTAPKPGTNLRNQCYICYTVLFIGGT